MSSSSSVWRTWATLSFGRRAEGPVRWTITDRECTASVYVPVTSCCRRANASASAAFSDSGIMAKAMATAKDVIDNYGAAYMMGSRLAGVGVVCAFYVLIKQGVDLTPILASLGVQEVGSTLGGYAAAVVLSSALYPVTLGASGYIAPVVAKLRKTVTP